MSNKKWVKTRHIIIKKILYLPFFVYTRIRYGLRVKKLSKEDRKQCLVLYNHQTGFDQFFVGLTVPMPIYYLATDDIFSLGFASSLIKYLVAPIPIKKQATDIKAVMDCLRVAKEGGTLAIAPEGNRTYSGATVYINPSIASLAKKLKLPIVFVRIEGGYGVQPRWSDVIRRGKVTSFVSRIMKPEEYEPLTKEQLTDVIRDELYVNEANADGIFKHKKSAEYLERCIYVCPYCGFSEFESSGDTVRCKKCGKSIVYTESKELVGNGFSFKFRFVKQWYDYQEDFVSNADLSVYNTDPAYIDKADVYRVFSGKKKEPVCSNAQIKLFGNRIEANGNDLDITMDFTDTVTVTVCGKNKLNIYYRDFVYQIKGDKRFNALKYVHFYFSAKNVVKESKDGKFMGI